MYREDGTPSSIHEYEDRSFHFCLDRENGTYLYGVFDGHDGAKGAYFASQRVPAELSFDQLTGKTSEEEVKKVFREAFFSVENAFLESIDPKIAERTVLLDKIPEGMKQFHAAQRFPDVIQKLKAIDQEIRIGTTAAVALIHNGILYVGNVGDSRVLLCKKDRRGVLMVKQLSVDHTTSSYEEMQRLQSIGLDPNKIKGAKLGDHEVTRCIGNYFLKGGYKEFDILSAAAAEPIIAEPSITSIPIDESCSFLLLMSDGLYKSYEEATGSEQVNKEIAQIVVEQFSEQTTLTSVAQTVVDKVVRLHHDVYLTRPGSVTIRDDITLVIRNFNFRLRGTLTPQLPATLPSPGSSVIQQEHGSTSSDDPTLCSATNTCLGYSEDSESQSCSGLEMMNLESGEFITNTNTISTESSELNNQSLKQISLDEQGRVRPYVSFDGYYEAIERAHADGLISDADLQLYK